MKLRSVLNKIAFILFGAALMLLLFTGCKKDDAQTDPKAPDFTLTSLEGNQYSLSDYANQVVVLYFIRYNCDGCLYGASKIEEELVIPYASRTDFQVLGLDTFDGNHAAMETFQTAADVTFPLLMNASSVGADYNTSYDRLVIVDKNGNIVFSGEDSAYGDLEEAKALVENLLGL